MVDSSDVVAVCGSHDSPAASRLVSSLRSHQAFVTDDPTLVSWNYGDMLAQILLYWVLSTVLGLLWLFTNQTLRCLEGCLGSHSPHLRVFSCPPFISSIDFNYLSGSDVASLTKLFLFHLPASMNLRGYVLYHEALGATASGVDSNLSLLLAAIRSDSVRLDCRELALLDNFLGFFHAVLFTFRHDFGICVFCYKIKPS